MPFLLATLYIGLSVLVGIRGSGTRAGFWGTTFLSLVFTPFLVFLAILVLVPARDEA